MLTIKKIIFGLILLCLCINVSFASTTAPSITKGFHVNDFKEVLGNKNKEDDLLRFAEQHGFNYLLLYNLYYINKNLYDLSDPEESIVLAKFIKKAKTQYGISEIGIVGEKLASFVWVQNYREDYGFKKNYRIDVYHLEFEFWNPNLVGDYYCRAYLEPAGLDCNSTGAFEFYQQELNQIDLLAASHKVRSETYIGNASVEQCAWIGQSCDRVLVHYYRKSDVYNNGNSIYQFKDYRIPALAPPSGEITILPLFSARSEFMGPWLTTNPEGKAYVTYLSGQAGYDEQEGDWKDRIVMEGYHWYRYTDLDAGLNNTGGFAAPSGFVSTTTMQAVDAESSLFRTASDLPLNHTIDATLPRLASSPSLAIHVYPNPVNQWLTLATANEKITLVEVYQINGVLFRVYNGEDIKGQQIDVSSWPEGQFVIYSHSDHSQQATQIRVKH